MAAQPAIRGLFRKVSCSLELLPEGVLGKGLSRRYRKLLSSLMRLKKESNPEYFLWPVVLDRRDT